MLLGKAAPVKEGGGGDSRAHAAPAARTCPRRARCCGVSTYALPKKCYGRYKVEVVQAGSGALAL